MIKIFKNLKTLEIELQKKTKTLSIKLNRPDCFNAINSQMIKELELIFTWCANHVEIHSLLLSANGKIFSKGFDFYELKNMSNVEVKKQILLFQKIIQSMFYLPQTIVIDLLEGAEGAACEFAIGADLRVSKPSAVLLFNHLQKGLVPMSGGIGFLNLVVSSSTARKWIMSSTPVMSNELVQSSFLTQVYKKSKEITNLLIEISKQAPVARIQTKRCFLQTMIKQLDKATQYEEEFSTGSLFSNDWRTCTEKHSNNIEDFVSANFYKEMVDKKVRSSEVHQ